MNNTTTKVYKIRDKNTGLFSKGGSDGQNIWNKTGKSWSNIGHVKNHLSLFINYKGKKDKDYPYVDAEIVEVEVNYDDCYRYNVEEMFDVMMESRLEEKQHQQRQYDKWVKERELKQLEELKEKYEGGKQDETNNNSK